MHKDIWLIVLGLCLVFFELFFGAICQLDIFFVGLSLIIAGAFYYFGVSWQLSLVISLVVVLFYFALLRQFYKKKLLIFFQRLKIDTVVGKTAVVFEPIHVNKKGAVLLDGEIWQAKAKTSFGKDKEVVVISLEKNFLWVAKPENL